MKTRRRQRRSEELEELVRLLFGSPMDPEDLGVLGRLSRQIEQVTSRVDSMLRLGWAVLLTAVAAVFALVVDMVLRLNSGGHP